MSKVLSITNARFTEAARELLREMRAGDWVGAHAAIARCNKILDGIKDRTTSATWQKARAWVEKADKLVEAASEKVDARQEGRVPQALAKSHVKGHTRRLKSGKVVFVREYDDKRTRKGQAQREQEQARFDYVNYGVRSVWFKRWFGDWERDPANASKVVTADGEPAETYNIPGTGSKVKGKNGKPVVVYHGTPYGGFRAFDPQKSHMGGLYGPGFYFTEDRSVAEGYQRKEDPGVWVQSDGEVWEPTQRDVDIFNGLRKTAEKAGLSEEYRAWSSYMESRSPSEHAEIVGDIVDVLNGPAQSVYEARLGALLADALGIVRQASSPEVKAVYLNIRTPLDLDEPVSADELRTALDRLPQHVVGCLMDDLRLDWDLPSDSDVQATREKLCALLRPVADGEVSPRSKIAQQWLRFIRDPRLPWTQDALAFTARGLQANLHMDISDIVDAVNPKAVMVRILQEVGKTGEQFVLDVQQAMKRAGLQVNRRFVDAAQLMGFDGFTHIGGHITGKGHEHRVWIAFDPRQVKAVDNVGTFDPADPDMFKGLPRYILFKSWPGERERHAAAARKVHLAAEGEPLPVEADKGASSKWDLRPKKDIVEAMDAVRKLYLGRNRKTRVFNPANTEEPFRLRFKATGAHHAVTRDPDNIAKLITEKRKELGRRLTKQEREELREFDPDRAARVHWIGRVLSHPEVVYEAKDSKGRLGYLMASAMPDGERPYVVFVQGGDDSDHVWFVTAYSYEKRGPVEDGLRLGRKLYPVDGNGEDETPQLEKSLRGRRIVAPHRVITPLVRGGRRVCPEGTLSPGWALDGEAPSTLSIPKTALLLKGQNATQRPPRRGLLTF